MCDRVTGQVSQRCWSELIVLYANPVELVRFGFVHVLILILSTDFLMVCVGNAGPRSGTKVSTMAAQVVNDSALGDERPPKAASWVLKHCSCYVAAIETA